MEEYLDRMGVQKWRELAQDQEKRRDFVLTAKTLKKY